MGLLIIGGLVLLVVHAACTEAAVQAAATAQQATSVPAPSTITSGSATPTPSPATSLGAPGAFNGYGILLMTNARFPRNGAGLYTTTNVYPGQNGIPLPFVPGVAQNGFNPNPSSNKSLNTQTRPGRPMSLPLNQLPANTPLYKL